MMNCILDLALGSIYVAESTMRFADQRLFAFLWEKIDCSWNTASSAASSCLSDWNKKASLTKQSACFVVSPSRS
jgi:hypothetical protein